MRKLFGQKTKDSTTPAAKPARPNTPIPTASSTTTSTPAPVTTASTPAAPSVGTGQPAQGAAHTPANYTFVAASHTPGLPRTVNAVSGQQRANRGPGQQPQNQVVPAPQAPLPLATPATTTTTTTPATAATTHTAAQPDAQPAQKAKPLTDKQLANLKTFIVTAQQLYQSGKYAEAYDMLRDKNNARTQLGIALNLNHTGISWDPGDEKGMKGAFIGAVSQAMSYAESKKIYFPQPYAHIPHDELLTNPRYSEFASGAKDPDFLNVFGDTEAAEAIIPIYIEEYMHMYQNHTQSFFSDDTAAFKQAMEAQQADYKPAGGWNEIDVMAAYNNMGIDVEKIGYVGRYGGRQDFWDWKKKQGKTD